MENDVIVLSSEGSDDEVVPPKANKDKESTWIKVKTSSSPSSSEKTLNNSSLKPKSFNQFVFQHCKNTNIGSPEDERTFSGINNGHIIVKSPIFNNNEISIFKRKSASNKETIIDKISPIPAKKMKSSNDSIKLSCNGTTSPKLSCNQVPSSSLSKNENLIQFHKKSNERNSPTPGCSSWFKEVCKPKLIVKEREILYDDEQDLFLTFINTCLKRDSSEDMKEIVKKLKKRHERLHPSFVNSDRFKELLIEKQKLIAEHDGKLFIHIQNIKDEMKNGIRTSLCIEKNLRKRIDSNDNNDDDNKKNPVNDEKIDTYEERRRRKKAMMILKSIEVCKKKIQQLEEEEVDFDDDEGSSYIKEDKYKKKLVELWNAYCKYSGEKVDADRVYLRPKDIPSTSIPEVDQAIKSFINSKISQRNKLIAKGKSIVDTVIFPDYIDILNTIAKCNEKKKLGLSKTTQEIKAKEAFQQIGEHLQRVRQNDYWDTFSLFLEDAGDDPALKDSSLAEKLSKNEAEGKKKMADLLDLYSKKQEGMAAEHKDDDENDETGDREEDNEEDEDEDEEVDVEEQRDVEGGNDDDAHHEKSLITKIKDADVSTPSINTLNVDNKTGDSSTHATKDLSSVKNDNLPKNSSSEVKDLSPGDLEVIEILGNDPFKANKQPVLRLRSFAKPPNSWEDSLQSESSQINKMPKATTTPKSSTPRVSPGSGIVDLTSDLENNSTLKTNLTRKVIDPDTVAALKSKFKTVVVPKNFKGKQIISVKNITNNYNVVNTPGNPGINSEQVITSVSQKPPDNSRTIIRIPSQNPLHLNSRKAVQMRINKLPDKGQRQIISIQRGKVNEKTTAKSLTILPNGNGTVFLQGASMPYSNIFANQKGQVVRVKTIVPNPESKIMKVLNLNDAQKVSITPLHKHVIINKIISSHTRENPNVKSNQLNVKSNQLNVKGNQQRSNQQSFRNILPCPKKNQSTTNNSNTTQSPSETDSQRIASNIVRIIKPGEQNDQNILSGQPINE